MAWRFKKLSTKADALSLVAMWSTIFYLLAGLQAVYAFVLSLGTVGSYLRLPPDALFDLLGTAGIVAILTYLVQGIYSRIAAVLLLTVSIGIFFTGLVYKSQGYVSGNPYLALVEIWAAARLVEATFKIHGRFAEGRVSERSAPQPSSQSKSPTADFISHPQGGLESAAASAACTQPPKPYDREKWAALLKYDDEIAVVVGRISYLGQRWIDEFAHAYLTLNDKQYLRKIEEKIYAAAMAERARSRL
jgi:hypothetical protein